jgi:hypothetical protein
MAWASAGVAELNHDADASMGERSAVVSRWPASRRALTCDGAMIGELQSAYSPYEG